MPTWVRCRDRDTGHEFDLSEDDMRVHDGSVEVLKDYPENSGLTAQPRPPKHRERLPRAEIQEPETKTAKPVDTPPAGTTATKKKE